MSKKGWIVLFCFIFFLIGFAMLAGHKGMGENSKSIQNRAEKQNSLENAIHETGTENNENENTTEEIKSAESTEKSTESVLAADGEVDTSGDTDNIENSNDESTDKKIVFPYTIPDSDIDITYMNAYNGYFLEDGSDEKMKNIATMLLKNNSDKVIEFGNIVLSTGKKELVFEFSTLPPGESCIVMEKNKSKFKENWSIQYVSSFFANMDELDKLESEISIIEKENNGIEIMNLTSKDIPRLRLFYKYQLETGEYVGGITYTCKVDDLLANESKIIYPSHYTNDGSVLMMIRKYEDKNN